ncbi:MAG: hypothetical protein ACOCZE_13305 [Planctomycetota bacterium]
MQYDAMEQRRLVARQTAQKILDGLNYRDARVLRGRLRNLSFFTGIPLEEIRKQARRDARILIDQDL